MTMRNVLGIAGAFLLSVSAALGQSPKSVIVKPVTVKPAIVKPAAQQSAVTIHKQGEGEEHLLAYRFEAGEQIRTQIIHQVMVDTKIKGQSEVARTHSIAAKRWDINSIDENGNITLTHQVESVEMTQAIGDRAEVRYNSQSGEDPPPGYESVYESLNKPLATITIDKAGRIVERRDERPSFNAGIGDLTVPLPGGKVKIGAEWSVQDEVKLTDKEKKVKVVKVRQRYTLDRVATGVATIAVDTQVLSPIDDPQLQSQLIQRLQKGMVKFDIDAGRLISRQMNLDETVVGFNGGESSMHYVARFTEEPIRESVARLPESTAR